MVGSLLLGARTLLGAPGLTTRKHVYGDSDRLTEGVRGSQLFR